MIHRSVPIILHIPHASVVIPAAVRPKLLLSDAELNREVLLMTDRYTDDLFKAAFRYFAAVEYPVSRLVVDPERFDRDEEEPMAAKGMGAIYTKTSDGRTLRETPSEAERRRLLDQFYYPHHKLLQMAVHSALARTSRVLIVDCHSFPSVPLPYEDNQSPSRPDICIGTDPYHTPPALVGHATKAFEAFGWTVSRDYPFSGALVPMEFFRTDPRVTSIMIEVNRGLYMNEKTGERLATYPRMSSLLHRCAQKLET